MKKDGFTLIELVVVLGLFMLVMGVAISMFISIIQHQKRILGQQEMLGQASYVQEYVARLLRNAAFDGNGACLAGGKAYLLTRFNAESGFFEGIKFMSAEGVCHEIFLDDDGVLKEIKGKGIAQNMLSPKFEIKYARFLIYGSPAAPRVTMAINIKEIVIQTTISKR